MKTLLLILPCALLALRADASALLKPVSGVSVALTPKSLALEAQLHGAFAQTSVTTVYSNPNSDQIEADFIYSAPKGSVVTGFAYWYQGEKVVARVAEKGRAAKIYSYITSRMRDPALIEMIGPNRFRARIFPVEARADLKIEVQLAQKLAQTPSGPVWTWPLREETRANRLAQLSVHVRSDAPLNSNLGAARNGVLNFERTNFRATSDARVSLPQAPAALRASLIGARDGGTDGFFALSLSSSTPVAFPHFALSGVKTYDVLIPTMRRLAANTPFVVLGRFRGDGRARVSLGGRQIAVNFSGARQSRNLPELLWASARMESLSQNARNQRAVTQLSQRFGMPSKWTSWLAIPEEERRTFKRQMMASDRAEAARAYAQAVSRGDAKAAQAQKVVFEGLTKGIQALGSNYAENEELQPLDSYLNDELRRLQSAVLQAKYDAKISRSQSAQWASWAKNLQRAGARGGGKGVDLPVYVVEDELRIASRLFLIEVEAGRKNGAQAKKMQARLNELAATKTAQQYGWGADEFVGEQAEARANALAMEIATNRASDKPDRHRERVAQTRLTRLDGQAEVDSAQALQSALQQVWGAKIEGVADHWASEIQAGRAGSDAARRDGRQVRALQARSGLKNVPQIEQAWNNFAFRSGTSLAKSIAAQGTSGTAARQLDEQIAAIAKQSGQKTAGLHAQAWAAVAQEVAARLQSQIQAEGEGQAARQLEARLQEVGTFGGTDTSYQVQNAWRGAAQSTAQKLAIEVKAGREDSPAARALETHLETQKKRAGENIMDWPLRQAWSERAATVATQLVDRSFKNGQLPPDAGQLRAQGQGFAAKGNAYNSSFEQLLLQNAGRKLTVLDAQLAEEVAAKRESSSKAVQLREQIAQGQKLFPGAAPRTYSGYSYRLNQSEEEFAWEGRAHEAAYRLLQAQASSNTSPARRAQLQSELDQSARHASKTPDAVIGWEKTRLAKNEPLVTADQYRLRPGDPLIAVAAPADCQRVVALMPDGTLLPLAWNGQNKTFEARFDVPTFAPEGDYQVRIILVGASGERRVLTMRFAVDLKSPGAGGTVARSGSSWRLSLQSDEQTDRVSAFTPWNERVELKRGANNLFAADAPVPADWNQGEAGATRFVVTDQAHNRTEIVVDPR